MKVLIVDDEPLARRRLRRMLERMPAMQVVGEAGDGEAALQEIERLSPDVVLLDIRMPGLDGMRLATTARGLPPIIFTTAYSEYAVSAFEACAVDYLLKPVEAARLEAALAKVPLRPAAAPDTLGALLRELLKRGSGGEVPRVTARAGNILRVFDTRDIARFQAADRYTIFKSDGREFVLDETLNALEERLGAWGFLRVHRAELVNLQQIAALRFEEGGTVVVLKDGQTAPVSRRHTPELKRRLGIAEA